MVTYLLVGIWGFNLSAQLLVSEVSQNHSSLYIDANTWRLQTVEEHVRARFSATEMALQNILGMLSLASIIVFSRPEQLQYAVMISSGAVAVAAVCFVAYMRKEREHLLHQSKCLGGEKAACRAVDSNANRKSGIAVNH